MKNSNNSLLSVTAYALLVVAVGVVYFQGLSGPFLFDDHQNFLTNPSVYVTALTFEHLWGAINSWGAETPPNRGLARLTLGLNYYFSGGRFDALDMKLTNVAIHVLNAWLLFALTRRLFEERFAAPGGLTPALKKRALWLALLAAAVWALHPLQLTAVLYVVQRMASLAGTFVLLGLLGYVAGRRRLAADPLKGTIIMLGTMGACVVLGYLCKQNAILLPFFALLCELCFFQRDALDTQARRGLRVVFGLSVVFPVVTAIAAMPWIIDYLDKGYANRAFDMNDRFMVQGRVMMKYLQLIFAPHFDAFTIWHDYIKLSDGWLAPKSTLISWLALTVGGLAACWFVVKRHVWAFAVLFFLVGHLLESTILPLEIVFEHRNYIPTFGLCIAIAYYLQRAQEALKMSIPSAVTVAVALTVALAFITYNRSFIWSDERILADHMIKVNPSSYRAHGLKAKVLAANNAPVTEIYSALQRAAMLDDKMVFGLIRMRRLLAALLYQFDRDKIEVPIKVSEPPADYRADLIIHPWYVQELAARIDEEIRRRIPGVVPHVETIAELGQVRLCILRNIDLCYGLLDEAMAWMRLLMEETPIGPGIRAQLMFVSSAFEARSGNFERALKLAQDASALHPIDPGMREQQAIYLGHMGRFDEAHGILDELEDDYRLDPGYMAQLAKARTTVEKMKDEAAESVK